jgi:hydantoinase/carbamoylase family amidase
MTNVIPGQVLLTFDLRDIDAAQRDQLEARIRAEIERICQARGLRAEIDEWLRVQPVTMHPAIMQAISQACAAAGQPAYTLPSGAGHDAQIMTTLTQAGMIFVRCRDGISHSPAEYVAPADALLGAQVLHYAVVALA